MMKVAVMGYGTVGSGVVEVIESHKRSITNRTGGEMLEVAHILDLRDFPGDAHEKLFTKDFNDILNDPEVKVVAETMGGVNPAYDFTLKLLNSGKSVVTSNKELVAQKGLELLNAAKENNVNYLFEASVGGGIPIIRPMAQCLTANNIEGIAGILNGTTNFILTKMIEDGMTFEDALKLAQENGYAEKDPTADIEGFDACRKVCILASLAFGKHVYPNQVQTEGITKITLEDVSYIQSANGVIKLLGQIKNISDDKIAAFVSPAVVFNGSQLASVNGVFNAILVRGDAVGDVCFYGQGAGKEATASAVVADMVDCAVHVDKRKEFGWGEGSESYVVDEKEAIEMPFYVRAIASESQIKAIFSEVKFLTRVGKPSNEVAFITDKMTQNALNKKLEGIEVINTIKVTNY
ncbi:MAG: homoserine dehydrogenase [Eubacterium sp.]